MKLFAAAALAALSLVYAPQAEAETPRPKATTFTVDFTGIWGNPQEAGWGMNIVQQSNTMFVTLFIYDANRQATWVVAPQTVFHSADDFGAVIFSGPLYRATGPAFNAGTFDPNSVAATQVGTLTIRFTTAFNAVVDYSIDSARVLKTVAPLTYRYNNLSGSYLGVATSRTAVCAIPVPATASSRLALEVTHDGAATISLRITDEASRRCTLSGTLFPYGKLSAIDGTYTCTTGTSGQFFLADIEGGVDGFTAALLTRNSGGCADSEGSVAFARQP